MPRSVPNGILPQNYEKSISTVTLYEWGNAPDYSVIYNIGVQAGHGESESYTLKNNMKGYPVGYIEITGNSGSDLMKYNYIKLDRNVVGGGVQYFFVTGKTIINYPEKKANGGNHWYTVGFNLELDFWETYKDKLSGVKITYEQMTTNNPAGWNDTTALDLPVIGFGSEKITTSPTIYNNWIPVCYWQAKKPTQVEMHPVDGIMTALQFTKGEDLSDYEQALKDMASQPPEVVDIFQTYHVANSYIVSEFFNFEKGGKSKIEVLQCPNPPSTRHGRLNYFPYKRAFIYSVDGQKVELNYNKFPGSKLPSTIRAQVLHCCLPTPNSLIVPEITEGYGAFEDVIHFKGYPSMNLIGVDSTPVTRTWQAWNRMQAVAHPYGITMGVGLNN